MGQVDICLTPNDYFRINTGLFIPPRNSYPATTTRPTTTPEAVDKNSNCSQWASNGECKNNPNYMLQNCAKSCKIYANTNFADDNPNCLARAKQGECQKNPDYMLKFCKRHCS